MKKELIFTKKSTKPTAWYSQAIKVSNIVYLSGVCGDDPQTGKIVGNGDIKIETRKALENLKFIVEESGGTLDNIVKMNVYIKDIKLLKDFNEVYKSYFPHIPPARIAMQIVDLADGASLEIDGIAML